MLEHITSGMYVKHIMKPLTTSIYTFEKLRDLLEGLELGDKDYDWKTYPVSYLDFGGGRGPFTG